MPRNYLKPREYLIQALLLILRTYAPKNQINSIIIVSGQIYHSYRWKENIPVVFVLQSHGEKINLDNPIL